MARCFSTAVSRWRFSQWYPNTKFLFLPSFFPKLANMPWCMEDLFTRWNSIPDLVIASVGASRWSLIDWRTAALTSTPKTGHYPWKTSEIGRGHGTSFRSRRKTRQPALAHGLWSSEFCHGKVDLALRGFVKNAKKTKQIKKNHLWLQKPWLCFSNGELQ